MLILNFFNTFSDLETLQRKYPFFNNKTYLFLGRLGEEKSISVLLDAFKKAYARDSELRLLIIGAGPGEDDYKAYVEKNKLGDVVKFMGRMPHKELIQSGIIHNSRALVTASVTENQPITIIEAIACNIPIIIPDVDGIKELLDNNGFSFPAGDVQCLSDILIKLAVDDELHRHYCSEGSRIRKKFDGMYVASCFEDIYKSLLN